MRAIRVRRFGGPELMVLEDVPKPRLSPDQVLVRVHAVGVNPVDTYIRSGLGDRPALPYTPGSDAAGLVEEVGTAVQGVRVGDQIYTSGTLTGAYAEWALCRPGQLHPLPKRLTFAQGAAIGVPYATAYRALFARGRAVAGETLFIHGASGGVGLAAVQLAVAAGLLVVGSASTEEGRRLVLSQGAAHALDHGSEHTSHLLELTGGRRANLILEMRCNANLGDDLTLLAPRGRVVCVGNRGPLNEGQVLINPRDLMRREGEVLGVMLPAAAPAELEATHAALGEGLLDGTLTPVVGEEYPLAQARAAHLRLEAGGAAGKVVLVP